MILDLYAVSIEMWTSFQSCSAGAYLTEGCSCVVKVLIHV